MILTSVPYAADRDINIPDILRLSAREVIKKYIIFYKKEPMTKDTLLSIAIIAAFFIFMTLIAKDPCANESNPSRACEVGYEVDLF